MVYAKMTNIDHPKKAMTAFLILRGEGVQVHHIYGLMGARGGGTGRVVFKDGPVPVENVLGGKDGIGRGTEVFHRMMVPERLTSAGGAVGMARTALEIAARYANRRKAFGQHIWQFEGVSFKIAESIILLDAARALNEHAARAIDAGKPPGRVRRLVSEAKKFATDSAWTIVNHAMQILGV
jgi:alkylation response protein AidB-like acyl-CoA dehydrogenase